MKQRITIQTILQGRSATQYLGEDGSYNSSIAIDPDFPITNSSIRTSGMAVPVQYEKFSGSNISGYPKWIITNPKDTNVYAYASDGKFVSYSSSLGSETLVGTPTSGAGNGGDYYNNYIYLPTPTDISRYGPLDGSPSLTNNVWTGATLGTQTALTNTTYPSIRGTPIPNHTMFPHSDNALYVCDVASNGQGIIHRIITKKVTNQGDTDNGSGYNVLDLPFGFLPTCVGNWGTDIMVGAIQTTNTTINQGNAMLFFWDPTNTTTFYNQVPLRDPLVTAIKNINGIPIIFSGNASNGVRVSQYTGGDRVTDIEFIEEGAPPFQGAVDALGNRIVWGGYTTYPANSASVFSYGSKNARLPNVLHNIIKTTSAGANQNVTALKYVQQASNVQPRLIVGWGDDSAKGIDKLSTTQTFGSYLRWNFNVGRKFDVVYVRIPLGATVTTNMQIIPKLYFDEESSSLALSTINSTNLSGKRVAIYKRPDLKTANGRNNFIFELAWGSTTLLPVLFPIVIDLEIYEDEQP